jgi:ribonuclease HI
MKKTEQQPADYVLYSDGGSSGGRTGAGACVVEETQSGERRHLAVFLGPSTNNEAEIAASLLGFACIRALEEGKQQTATVRWVADSEYLLKSATGYIRNWQRNGWKTAEKKPVKNQGLWQSYLALSAGLKILPEHVRGHTGHAENETCDEAVQWVKAGGERFFSGNSPIAVEEFESSTGIADWLCIDGADWLERLRSEQPTEEDRLWLYRILQSQQPTGSRPDTRRAQPEKQPKSLTPSLSPVLLKLKEAQQAALQAAPGLPKARALADSIASLIRDFE